jgi:dipeptidyl aminopeptidase/acylaminoacyl peptidase
MKPVDIADVVEVSDPRVSPDGRTVAFVVTRADLDQNRNASAVWVAGVDAGSLPPVPLTSGETREARPRWSPDGTQLAFVAHPKDKGATLCVVDVDADGDGVTELLEWPEDVEDLVWAPDGRRLVFSARQRDEAQYGPEKDRDRPFRRVDRLQYRLDNVGWTIDRPRHLFAIAVDGDGKPVELTTGPYSDAVPAVSPDGRTIVFSSARTPTWDTDLSTHLYRIALDGDDPGEPEQLTAGTTTHGQPAISPDGRHVAFVWGDRHSMMRHGQVGVVDLTATDVAGSERLLTRDLGLHCAPYLAAARDPLWEGDGALLFQVDEAGNVPVYRARLDGAIEKVVGGDRQVVGFDANGGTFAFVATSATEPPDVFVVVGGDGDGEERRLTSFAAHFHASHVVATSERFTATSADGTEVEAWVMRPTAAVAPDADGRHPVLLNVHGGPFSQYGNRFFDEFQVQAEAGYAALYCNPRGSSGYSEAFSRGIRGPGAAEDPGTGWGGADYEDVMAVVDEALRRFDFLDASRLGVLGGSYGGYMTSWIIGHTDRFKAALSERALNNMLTFAHTSDIGAHFPAGYLGVNHLEDPDEFVRESPVTYWRDMRTPVLILHAENDLRCPIEQAEDLYVRLKLAGRDVEFVRAPGESHELSRSGAPRHRVERLELVLDWFARKLR